MKNRTVLKAGFALLSAAIICQVNGAQAIPNKPTTDPELNFGAAMLILSIHNQASSNATGIASTDEAICKDIGLTEADYSVLLNSARLYAQHVQSQHLERDANAHLVNASSLQTALTTQLTPSGVVAWQQFVDGRIRASTVILHGTAVGGKQ